MSMSQEEIEALMNGLDIVDDDNSAVEEEPSIVQEETTVVNTDEIEELISQNEEVNIEEVSIPVEVNNEEIEPLSNDEEITSASQDENLGTVANDDIDALLKDLEVDEPKDESEDIFTEFNNDISSESFDDESADEEGIVESTVTKNPDEVIPETSEEDIIEPTVAEAIADEIEESSDNKEKQQACEKEEIGKDWADSKIDEGMFPLPAGSDTKVVNQLSQVANDSEEKVSQIFDVLSLTLDNNNDIRDKMKSFETYIDSDLELLNSLSNKFPNIEIFNTQKELAKEMSTNLQDIREAIDSEDMKIFQAMELMQFNDINRQKIERVMSVIRKLSLYLNNLFEDDGSSQDISVAKHIHGDKDHDLVGEDLDKLIDEFAK